MTPTGTPARAPRGDRGRFSRRALLGSAVGAVAVSALPGCRSAVQEQQSSSRGSLTLGQVGDVLTKAPLSETAYNQSWRGNVLQGLSRWDPRKRTMVPVLATASQVDPVAKTATYTIRPGVTWHSGRPFEAADVVATFQALKDGTFSRPFPYAWLLKTIRDVSADGDKVIFSFNEYVAGAERIVGTTTILDKESFPDFNSGTACVGTGPFKIDKYVPGDKLVLRRHDGYWDKGTPRLAGYTVQIFDRADALLAAVRTNQVQLTTALSPRDVDSVAKTDGVGVERLEGIGPGVYLGCNVEVKPLNDKRVRQAIASAIDRNRIVKDVLKGYGTASCAPWGEGSAAFSPQTRDYYHYDPAKARALLSAAGASGAKITYEVGAGQDVFREIAQIVAFNLKEAGLDVETRTLTTAETDERFLKGSWSGIYTAGHGGNGFGAFALVRSSRPWTNTNNLFRFKSAKFDAIVDRLRQASNAEQEKSIGDEMTRYILDEAFVTELVLREQAAVTRGVQGWGYDGFSQVLLGEAQV